MENFPSARRAAAWTVTVTGTSALKGIEIKPDVVDPDDNRNAAGHGGGGGERALKAATQRIPGARCPAVTGGMGGLGGGLF